MQIAYHNCVYNVNIIIREKSFIPTECRASKILSQMPECSLWLCIWETAQLVLFLTRVLSRILKFHSWASFDPNKSLKNTGQREMVLPDLEISLLDAQRLVSCGEKNILGWIKDMFVCWGECDAERQRQRRILRSWHAMARTAIENSWHECLPKVQMLIFLLSSLYTSLSITCLFCDTERVGSSHHCSASIGEGKLAGSGGRSVNAFVCVA